MKNSDKGIDEFLMSDEMEKYSDATYQIIRRAFYEGYILGKKHALSSFPIKVIRTKDK